MHFEDIRVIERTGGLSFVEERLAKNAFCQLSCTVSVVTDFDRNFIVDERVVTDVHQASGFAPFDALDTVFPTFSGKAVIGVRMNQLEVRTQVIPDLASD